MSPRTSGVLLPIPCLPSGFGIGDLGPCAYRFADYLHAAGQRVWQILPLNPTTPAYQHSPYHGASAFACNPLLISPEHLAAEGLLDRDELPSHEFPEGRVDYAAVAPEKKRLLDKACAQFKQRKPGEDYARFCAENDAWLDDFTLFTALSTRYPDVMWNRWPHDVQQRHPEALARLRAELGDRLEDLKIVQYFFFRQWVGLRAYCREKGIRIFGDLPIYVPFHSADVWAHPRLFKLDETGSPLAVSGVPPDYFSTGGQLWGHPVYRWDAHRETRYEWWIRRFARNLALFDYVRIDHFRGLVAYWEVPAGEPTAVNGRWLQTPAEDFFNELRHRFVCLPLIAEDLGVITADVRETMQRFGFPGMRVLMFGFSEDPATNVNAIHNIIENCVVFTGTHDNNTVKGWLESEASALEKRRLGQTIGREPAVDGLHWDMIRLAMMSPARMCITPVQDLLGLGSEARINTPGRWEGNWQWRMSPGQFTALPQAPLRELTEAFGRL
jgi:4-alpha-glucanotransferase